LTSESVGQRGKLTTSEYVFAIQNAYRRLSQTIDYVVEVKHSNQKRMIKIIIPLSTYKPPIWILATPPVQGSLLKERFLGN